MELEFKIMHFSYFLLIMGLKFASIKTAAADSPRLQAVHVLDPGKTIGYFFLLVSNIGQKIQFC
jgi:multisubunit Na+/H+ antiporter MnhE subunit